MSRGTQTAPTSCNEKKNWEMLPFMCDDDDESRSSVVEAYTEKRKSFGETKHFLSCSDCKKNLVWPLQELSWLF